MLDDEAGNEKADEVDGVIDAGRQKVVCCCGCWSGGSLMKRQKVVCDEEKLGRRGENL